MSCPMRLAGLLPTTPSDELLRPTREREEDSFSFRPQQTDAIHRTAGEQRTQQGRRRMTCREAKAVVLFHKRCKSLYDFPTVDCSVRFPARGRISDRVGAWADRHSRVGASPSMPALSERWIGFLASKWKERGDCCWPAKKHAAKAGTSRANQRLPGCGRRQQTLCNPPVCCRPGWGRQSPAPSRNSRPGRLAARWW